VGYQLCCCAASMRFNALPMCREPNGPNNLGMVLDACAVTRAW
jgi:hypothetical protein